MVTLSPGSCLEVPYLTLSSPAACRGKLGTDFWGFSDIHQMFWLLHPERPSTSRDHLLHRVSTSAVAEDTTCTVLPAAAADTP